jgi:hypothetical protein
VRTPNAEPTSSLGDGKETLLVQLTPPDGGDGDPSNGEGSPRSSVDVDEQRCKLYSPAIFLA